MRLLGLPVVLTSIVIALASCSASPGGSDPPCAPTEHRAQAAACAPSPSPPSPGAIACSTDADCQGQASGYAFCRGGQCAFDECLTDADCSNGGVCGCSTDYYGGNAAYHPNVCVPGDCHVDSDCGGNAVCAPSRGSCGTLESFHCAPASAPACGASESCVYSPEIGGFACGASAVCNG